jgi:hypothetical protein
MKHLSIRWIALGALVVGCAERYESQPIAAVPLQSDAGPQVDSTSEPTDGGTSAVPDAANDGSSPTYCSGWTFCDTFEGTGNIPWRSRSDGPLAKTEISALRANSGSFALRGYRTAPTIDGAELVFAAKILQRCEYDVLIANNADASRALIEPAYLGLSSAPEGEFYFQYPVRLEFGPDSIGFNAFYSGRQTSAPDFARKLIRDIWHHMALELTLGNAGIIGSKVFLTANTQAAESRELTFSEIYYSGVNFAIGLTGERTSATGAEVFIDNVRCR